MTSDIERLKARIKKEHERNLAENQRIREEHERSAESARRQARRDVPQWVSTIERLLMRFPASQQVTLHAKRLFGIFDWEANKLCPEPSVDREFLRYSDEDEGLLAGEAYAKELRSILGQPFLVVFHPGYEYDVWYSDDGTKITSKQWSKDKCKITVYIHRPGE